MLCILSLAWGQLHLLLISIPQKLFLGHAMKMGNRGSEGAPFDKYALFLSPAICSWPNQLQSKMMKVWKAEEKCPGEWLDSHIFTGSEDSWTKDRAVPGFVYLFYHIFIIIFVPIYSTYPFIYFCPRSKLLNCFKYCSVFWYFVNPHTNRKPKTSAHFFPFPSAWNL